MRVRAGFPLGCSWHALADAPPRFASRLVVDQTGLDRRPIRFRLARVHARSDHSQGKGVAASLSRAADADRIRSGSSLPTAVQEQLGLRLDPLSGPP